MLTISETKANSGFKMQPIPTLEQSKTCGIGWFLSAVGQGRCEARRSRLDLAATRALACPGNIYGRNHGKLVIGSAQLIISLSAGVSTCRR